MLLKLGGFHCCYVKLVHRSQRHESTREQPDYTSQPAAGRAPEEEVHRKREGAHRKCKDTGSRGAPEAEGRCCQC